jgi:hypothetical protein
MKVLDSQLNDGFSSPCAPSLRLFGGSGLTKYISPFGLFLDFFVKKSPFYYVDD